MLDIHENFNISLLNRYFINFEEELIKFDFYLHKCYYARAIYIYKKRLLIDHIQRMEDNQNDMASLGPSLQRHGPSSNMGPIAAVGFEKGYKSIEQIIEPVGSSQSQASNTDSEGARLPNSNDYKVNSNDLYNYSPELPDTQKAILPKIIHEVAVNLARKILVDLF